MDLLALAVPFFLLALLLELLVDRIRGTAHYRSSDAINSLSAGTLSTTTAYFSKILPAVIFGMLVQDYSLFDISLSSFNGSASGLMHWLVALLAFDFCYYWAHRFGHERSILWAAHSVHHQSEDYNLSTALRQTSTGFLFSWIFYVPLFILGMPVEVYVTVNALDLIYQFWVHTQHVGKMGWIDRVFVTPSNHRVHHAQNEIYIDKNYGGILILWDRLFGSFQQELDQQSVTFGVRKPLANWNPIWANFQVYSYLLFDARKTKRWKDKMGVWFGRTGWRPADVEAQFPKGKSDLETFRKFDPAVPVSLRRYVLAQFLLAAVAVLWIGFVYASDGIPAVIIPCLLLWAALYTIGILNEGRSYAVAAEAGRLLLLMPAGVYGYSMQGLIDMGDTRLWLMLGLYCLVSMAWLAISGNIGDKVKAARN
jgi:alkylglycerol monooxygenase